MNAAPHRIVVSTRDGDNVVGFEPTDMPGLTPPAMVVECGGPLMQRGVLPDGNSRPRNVTIEVEDAPNLGSKEECSRRSSRGGSKPKLPIPNPNTQTGTLG
jgi:hypothetical protein